MLFVLTLLIGGFAVWSITSLLVYERGPFNLFGRIRNFAGVIVTAEADGEHLNRWLEKNPGSAPEDIPERFGFTEVGQALSCFWCVSMWVSFVVSGYMLWAGYIDLVISPVFAFALRGIAIMADELIHG